jgi:hypothetical protein
LPSSADAEVAQKLRPSEESQLGRMSGESEEFGPEVSADLRQGAGTGGLGWRDRSGGR